MTTVKITTANALNCSFNLSCVANTLLKIGKVICVNTLRHSLLSGLASTLLEMGKDICVKHVAPLVTKWLDLWMGYAL